MDADLLERMLALHRVAQQTAVGDVLISDLVRALALVRSGVTAREHNRGGMLVDADGRSWEAKLTRLLREAQRARTAPAIRAVSVKVMRALEPVKEWVEVHV